MQRESTEKKNAEENQKSTHDAKINADENQKSTHDAKINEYVIDDHHFSSHNTNQAFNTPNISQKPEVLSDERTQTCPILAEEPEYIITEKDYHTLTTEKDYHTLTTEEVNLWKHHSLEINLEDDIDSFEEVIKKKLGYNDALSTADAFLLTIFDISIHRERNRFMGIFSSPQLKTIENLTKDIVDELEALCSEVTFIDEDENPSDILFSSQYQYNKDSSLLGTGKDFSNHLQEIISIAENIAKKDMSVKNPLLNAVKEFLKDNENNYAFYGADFFVRDLVPINI